MASEGQSFKPVKWEGHKFRRTESTGLGPREAKKQQCWKSRPETYTHNTEHFLWCVSYTADTSMASSGGGGGSFLACGDFGKMFDHSFPACVFSSSSGNRPETTVAECSLTSCVWARFRIGSHTVPGQRHSHPILTSLGQRFMRV